MKTNKLKLCVQKTKQKTYIYLINTNVNESKNRRIIVCRG